MIGAASVFMEDDELIRRAAAYMDRVKPDWWNHVDPLTLDLSRSYSCVCGQNGLGWSEHASGLEGAFSDRSLEPFWLEEIAKRMPAPVIEPVLA